MGQRANLVIVSGNKYEIYYDHWCANVLDQYIFWGESHTINFFRKHKPDDESAWLDTVWCEGGAVLDLNRKHLLFFGGEDLLFDVAIRDVYLKLMHYNWPGYKISWAHNGILDLADYVGVSREIVIAPMHKELPDYIDRELPYAFYPGKAVLTGQNSLSQLAEEQNNTPTPSASSKNTFPEETIAVCSLIQKDGTIFFYTLEEMGIGFAVLLGGEKLITCLENSYPREPDSIVYYDDFPRFGIHIDLRKKELYLWWSNPRYSKNLLAELWPGWKITTWEGNYVKHIEATDGKLKFPSIGIDKILATIEKIVLPKEVRPDDCHLQPIRVFTEMRQNFLLRSL